MSTRQKSPEEIVRNGITYKKLDWFAQQAGIRRDSLCSRVCASTGTIWSLDYILVKDNKNLPVCYINISELDRIGKRNINPPRYITDNGNRYECILDYAERMNMSVESVRNRIKRSKPGSKIHLPGKRFSLGNLNIWYVLMDKSEDKPEIEEEKPKTLRKQRSLPKGPERIRYLIRRHRELDSDED